MNTRKATIEDIDILIKFRIDYLLSDISGLTTEEESMICSQLRRYITKYINTDFIAILLDINKKAVSAAFLAISEKPANPAFMTGKTGTLLNVFTYPEYRKMGYATEVISRFLMQLGKKELLPLIFLQQKMVNRYIKSLAFQNYNQNILQ